jgi:hypothetical protein
MNDNVKVTLKISVLPASNLAQWLAAARLVRDDAPQLVEVIGRRLRNGLLCLEHVSDPGHAHTINDPGHSHDIIMPTNGQAIVDPHLEMMARNLMTVRALPCSRE